MSDWTVVTRAQPGAECTAQRLEAAGFRPLMAPVLRVAPVLLEADALTDAHAVLLTSANAARQLPRLWTPGLATTPIFAVGPATAEAAREAGCRDVRIAGPDAEGLVRRVCAWEGVGRGKLVFVRGVDVTLDVAAALQSEGLRAESVIAYEAAAEARLPAALAEALREGAVAHIVVHSVRGARMTAHLIQEAGLASACSAVAAVAVSAKAAVALETLAFRTLAIAPREALAQGADAAMLAALAQLGDGGSVQKKLR